MRGLVIKEYKRIIFGNFEYRQVWESELGELSVLRSIGEKYKSPEFRVSWISWEIVSRLTKSGECSEWLLLDP